MTDLLNRIDDLHDTPFGLAWAPLMIAAAASCVAGYSLLGKYLSSLAIALIVLSLVLRGIWLQGLWWRSLLAIGLLVLSTSLTDTAPHEDLAPLVWFLLATIPGCVAIWLFYKICLVVSWWPDEPSPHAEASI